MRRLEYKWLVGIAFVFGIFMDILDTTIINVALPDLQREFNTGVSTIEWIVTGYLLSLAVFIPASGYLGDRFGTKRIYLTALVLFTAASALGGLAWNAPSLIAFRVAQGVGGGMLVPVGAAMLFRAFPPQERARASAVLALPTVLAPALGPILGGALVQYADWRWIFWVNLPVGVAGFIFSRWALREHREPNPGRLDVPGFVLSASGFSALLYGLSAAAERGGGLDSPRALSFLALGGALLVALTVVELRTSRPMFDVRLLRDRGFATANLLTFTVTSGLLGGLFLYPLFLQNPQLKNLSPLESGLTTFPQAVGVGLMMPFAGRMYHRLGGKPMVVIGSILFLVSSLVFTQIDVDTSTWMIRGTLVLRGMGMGLVFVAVQTLAFAGISGPETGRASSLFNVNRQVAGSFGVAVLATTLTSRIGHHVADAADPQRALVSGFQDAFWMASAVALLGVVVALVMRVRPATAADTQTVEEDMVAA
jgi:EmrB/QacA subfamily drug resistance transporter